MATFGHRSVFQDQNVVAYETVITTYDVPGKNSHSYIEYEFLGRPMGGEVEDVWMVLSSQTLAYCSSHHLQKFYDGPSPPFQSPPCSERRLKGHTYPSKRILSSRNSFP